MLPPLDSQIKSGKIANFKEEKLKFNKKREADISLNTFGGKSFNIDKLVLTFEIAIQMTVFFSQTCNQARTNKTRTLLRAHTVGKKF